MQNTYFISGHIDLDILEFDQYYKPVIDSLLLNENSQFVIGDAQGADTMAREYLANRIDKSRIKIYTLNIKKLKKILPEYTVIGGQFKNHDEKDAAMTNVSIDDIAYVRPADVQKNKLEARGITYDPNRLSGTEKNLLRRKNNKLISFKG